MAAVRRKSVPAEREEDASDSRERPASDGKLIQHVAWVHYLTVFTERFGVPFGLLMVCLGAVWCFGDAKTHNDFIRELLFGEITHRPTVGLIFLGLILIILVGNAAALFRRASREPKEVKRIADEKARLQEKLIGTELSHTQKGPEA